MPPRHGHRMVNGSSTRPMKMEKWTSDISSAVDPAQAPIQLTNDGLSQHHSPAWSPQGRQVAFVSNRSGEDEIWLVQLDKADADRFINASGHPLSNENHPTWSGDGSRLAWSSSGGNSPSGIYDQRYNPTRHVAGLPGSGRFSRLGSQQKE